MIITVVNLKIAPGFMTKLGEVSKPTDKPYACIVPNKTVP